MSTIRLRVRTYRVGRPNELGEFVREHESTWLDEHIPALARLTPREAAADPTRRPDLIRLLDSFPPPTERGLMDPARLRAELGPEERR